MCKKMCARAHAYSFGDQRVNARDSIRPSQNLGTNRIPRLIHVNVQDVARARLTHRWCFVEFREVCLVRRHILIDEIANLCQSNKNR